MVFRRYDIIMNNINVYHISMGPQELRSLPIQPGQSLRVLTGKVWMTAIGDFTDYIINEGEVIEIPVDKSGILLQSLSARLEIEIAECA